ncbi:MAG: hypothetical protein ACYS6K_27130, partial [Planctomycetota bacterium]
RRFHMADGGHARNWPAQCPTPHSPTRSHKPSRREAADSHGRQPWRVRKRRWGPHMAGAQQWPASRQYSWPGAAPDAARDLLVRARQRWQTARSLVSHG